MHKNLLDRDDTILLVVDMQEPFLRGVFEKERVIEQCALLANAANMLGIPILATIQYGERMGDVIPEVAKALPSPHRIDKTTFSCCGVERFQNELQSHGKSTALISGVEAHICVSQTAHDLLDMGYKVHVAADGVSSRTERNWQYGITKMRDSGVVVTSVETAIYELLKDAAAPEFRSILKLVKSQSTED